MLSSFQYSNAAIFSTCKYFFFASIGLCLKRNKTKQNPILSLLCNFGREGILDVCLPYFSRSLLDLEVAEVRTASHSSLQSSVQHILVYCLAYIRSSISKVLLNECSTKTFFLEILTIVLLCFSHQYFIFSFPARLICHFFRECLGQQKANYCCSV